MVAAYILIQTDVGLGSAAAQALREIPGVSEVVEVIGPYDVIARIEAASVEELGHEVIGPIHKVPGITRTQTCTVVTTF